MGNYTKRDQRALEIRHMVQVVWPSLVPVKRFDPACWCGGVAAWEVFPAGRSPAVFCEAHKDEAMALFQRG